MSHQANSINTVKPDELARFEAIAKEWWNPSGKFKPLHKFNPVRLSYIKQKVQAHFQLDADNQHNTNNHPPLKGLDILDVGCGGGLICEPLARLGANVVGLDAGEVAIHVAKSHAKDMGLEIDYRCETVENLASGKTRFDLVLNMEVVEHVDDVPSFMKACCDLVKPGGLLLNATLNRTLKSYALAIVGAEYILRWLPRGTHDWNMFIRPEELIAHIEAAGLTTIDQCGVSYNPLADHWSQSRNMDVNYMVLAQKPS